jgi:hypothetical protein
MVYYLGNVGGRGISKIKNQKSKIKMKNEKMEMKKLKTAN